MKITIISAMTPEKIIGKNNDLPWKIPKEWAHFKKMTMNKPVIMGKNSYVAIENTGLPGRDIIVLSKTLPPSKKYKIARTIDEALELASYAPEVMICGGTEVYKQFLTLADEMILSFIFKKYEGDTYFPEYNEDNWQLYQEDQEAEFVIKYLKRDLASS